MSSWNHRKHAAYFLAQIQANLSQLYRVSVGNVVLDLQVKLIISALEESLKDKEVDALLKLAAANIWVLVPDPSTVYEVVVDGNILVAACKLLLREE